ncbi:MAG: outer membrane lipoprotein carrier protein LolA [Gammaproteobacteria bacterium]|nr:MAG: outer membrane lipoprotein carrier protein LolA [Gammaproteobacteria bacterium]
MRIINQSYIGQRTLCFIFVLFFCVQATFAADILDELKAKTVKAKSVSGDFTQIKMVKGISISLKSTGIFSYVKDDKLVWHLQKPIENVYSIEYDQINKKSAIEDIVDGMQTTSDQYQNIVTMFLDMFSGNWSVLEKYFSISGDSNESGWRVKLTPTDELFKSMFISLTLQGDQYIDNMQIEEKNGDRTRIEFSNVKLITAVSSSKANEE